jgi:hypothetical protein
MNNIANFTAVRRTSRPDAIAHEDDGISVLVKLNVEPDGHWERFFGEQQDDQRLAEKATVSRRPHDAHPGVVGRAPGIYFQIQSASELTEATNKIDELIEATNRHYTEVFIPAEEKRADAERRKESELATLQAQLDRVAAELLPPDGEEEPPPRTRTKPVPRIPTRSTHTSRDW